MCSARTVRSRFRLEAEISVVPLTPRGAAFGGGQFEWNLI